MYAKFKSVSRKLIFADERLKKKSADLFLDLEEFGGFWIIFIIFVVFSIAGTSRKVGFKIILANVHPN